MGARSRQRVPQFMESVVTRGQADSGTWLRGLNSVVLKNETVIRPVHGFPRGTGVVMSPGSGASAASAARSGLLPAMDQVCAFAAPSTCRVHPLPRVRGGVRCTSEATRGGAHKGKHDRVPCRSLDRQVLERMAATGAGIGCRHGIGSACDALQGAPGDERRRGHKQGSANKVPTGRDLGGHGQPDSRIRPSGQVTTATPFAPRRSWPSGAAIGSRQLTPARQRRQGGALTNGADSGRFRVALNGGEMRLHFQIDCRGCFAPGLDMDGLGLWFGAGSLMGMVRSAD